MVFAVLIDAIIFFSPNTIKFNNSIDSSQYEAAIFFELCLKFDFEEAHV
jgi:hypothetical protein